MHEFTRILLLNVQVLQYLLDDVSDFLSNKHTAAEESNLDTAEGKASPEEGKDDTAETKGCAATLKAFIDHISERERENFHSRRHDNKDSVALSTMHQVLYSLSMMVTSPCVIRVKH